MSSPRYINVAKKYKNEISNIIQQVSSGLNESQKNEMKIWLENSIKNYINNPQNLKEHKSKEDPKGQNSQESDAANLLFAVSKNLEKWLKSTITGVGPVDLNQLKLAVAANLIVTEKAIFDHHEFEYHLSDYIDMFGFKDIKMKQLRVAEINFLNGIDHSPYIGELNTTAQHEQKLPVAQPNDDVDQIKKIVRNAYNKYCETGSIDSESKAFVKKIKYSSSDKDTIMREIITRLDEPHVGGIMSMFGKKESRLNTELRASLKEAQINIDEEKARLFPKKDSGSPSPA